jgi:hypothetical protein
MDSALRILRIIQAALLGSVLLYVLLAARFGPPPRPTIPFVLFMIALMAVAVSVGIFVVRRIMVKRAENVLQTNAADSKALARWQAGHIVILALAEAIALYGLVLRFVGFRFSQVLPFFVASFILMLFFGPRRLSDAIG